MLAILFLPLFAISALAIRVTKPSNSSAWSTTGPQEITWESVSTDPTSISIRLSSDSSVSLIAENIPTSAGSYVYTPRTNLFVSNIWRISIVSADSSRGILAQSDYFAVTEDGQLPSSSASPNPGASGGRSSVSQTQPPGASGSSPTQSGNPTSSSAAPASSPTSGATHILASPIGLVFAGLAAMGLVA